MSAIIIVIVFRFYKASFHNHFFKILSLCHLFNLVPASSKHWVRAIWKIYGLLLYIFNLQAHFTKATYLKSKMIRTKMQYCCSTEITIYFSKVTNITSCRLSPETKHFSRRTKGRLHEISPQVSATYSQTTFFSCAISKHKVAVLSSFLYTQVATSTASLSLQFSPNKTCNQSSIKTLHRFVLSLSRIDVVVTFTCNTEPRYVLTLPLYHSYACNSG